MDDSDHRQRQRRPIGHVAHLATGLGPPLKCYMIDISQSGARISVDNPKTSPQEFLLLINNDLARWCRVVWRSEHELGLTFIHPPTSLTTPEHAAKR